MIKFVPQSISVLASPQVIIGKLFSVSDERVFSKVRQPIGEEQPIVVRSLTKSILSAAGEHTIKGFDILRLVTVNLENLLLMMLVKRFSATIKLSISFYALPDNF
tara:strand:- start:148 stop:462 length:315 start_codon:yes stop_codon:yes gene_type:complete